MTTTDSWSPSEARGVLDDLNSSGLSVAEFYRQRGIPAHRAYWARRKAQAATRRAPQSDATRAGDFGEVAVVDVPTVSASPIELRLLSGLSISVARGFDELTLRHRLGLLAPC